MNKDKALIKTLIRKTDNLPEGFEEQVMNRILLETGRKDRRNYYLSLILVSVVSLGMIGGTLYVLDHFFSFNILSLFSGFHMKYDPLYKYCFYIAFLVLVLLGLDYKFRQIMKKTGNP